MPREPDADFDSLRELALAAIRKTQEDVPEGWTDHNLHDPGITMLEAAVWSIADLHYRTEEREGQFDGWSAELSAWRGSGLARGEATRAAAATVLRDHLEEAQRIQSEASSRSRAIVGLTRRFSIPASAASSVARVLREPLLLRAVLDRSGAVARAIEEDSENPRRAVAAAVEDLGLWPEEVDALIARERRRRLVDVLRTSADEVRAIVETAPHASGARAALEARFDLTPDQSWLALALHPCPPVPASFWESAPGATGLWPPHPLQMRTCEPATGEDYRRLLLNTAGVKRAWVLKGLAPGIRWDGEEQKTSLPHRQGALTFLVEPDQQELKALGAPLASADRAFLSLCLQRALAGQRGLSEQARPFPDYRENVDDDTPRRLLGDEIGAALLTACGVVVKGTLEIASNASGERVLRRAEDLLEGFLSSDRISPLERPAASLSRLSCPEDLDGPWPMLVEAAVTAPVFGSTRGRAYHDAHEGVAAQIVWSSPEEAQRAGRRACGICKPPQASAGATTTAWYPREQTPEPGGWPPGEPIHVSEVVQLLQQVPGVLGVDGLALQAADDPEGDWESETLTLDAFCVPRYERHCLCLQVFNPQDCHV